MDEPTALMTVRGTDRPPTIESAAEQLGVAVEDIDTAYGVVLVNPDERLFAVQVRADRLPASNKSQTYRGPFANPRIDAFAPVVPDPSISKDK